MSRSRSKGACVAGRSVSTPSGELLAAGVRVSVESWSDRGRVMVGGDGLGGGGSRFDL